MIPALLAATALAGEPTLETRLLGPEPVVEVVAPSPEAPPLPVPWPLLAVAGAGLVLFGFRKPLLAALTPGKGETASLTVVSRKSLGQGAIAVVDVADPSGEVRRLLVGTGAAGPRLLADLSADFSDLLLAEEP